MPSTEESRSAWNSPWRGSSPGRSAAGSRHDSGTTNAAATIAISAAASPSSSSRSAPATRSLRSPHCQMHRPAAVASVVSERAETTSRWRSLAEHPADQHDADPGGQRDHGREPGVVDVGGGEGHRRLRRVAVQRRVARVQRRTRGARSTERSAARPAVGVAGGARRRDLVLDRRVAAAEDQARVERQADDAGDERRQHQRVAEPDLARLDPVRLAVVHRALEQADRVEGREHDPDRRPRRRRRSSPGRRRSGCRTRR